VERYAHLYTLEVLRDLFYSLVILGLDVDETASIYRGYSHI
jgi:hypothetical protein